MKQLDTRPRKRSMRQKALRFLSGLTAITLLASGFFSAPINNASAAEIKAILEVVKETTSPSDKIAYSGDQVVFSIEVGCQSQESHCWDAILTDTVPAPLIIDDIQFVSDGDFPDPIITVTGNTFTAEFQDFASAFPGRIGLQSGHGMVFSVHTTVPAGYTLSAPELLTNEVLLTSTDAEVASDSDSDTVEIRFKNLLQAGVSKTWNDAELVAGSAGSSFSLEYRNTSNVDVTTLTIVDPAGGSTPFSHFSFAGFDASGGIFPEGADQVAVTLVLDGAASVQFPAAGALPSTAEITAALLPGTLDDIIGFELEFSSAAGSAIVANGAPGALTVGAAQRPSLESLTSDLQVLNIVEANVSLTGVPDADPVTDQDAITVVPQRVQVSVSKNFVNAAGNDITSLLAGETAGALLAATSLSNVTLDSMTISDPPATGTGATFSEQGVEFNGFGLDGSGLIPAAQLPSGTTGATVRYSLSDGSTVDFVAPGDFSVDSSGMTIPTPVLSTGVVVDGFEVTVLGSDFPENAAFSLAYQFTEINNTARTLTNTADASATSGTLEGRAPPASDELIVIEPRVDSVVRKELNPGDVWGLTGADFTAGLVGRLDGADGTSLSTIPVREFVLEDSVLVSGTPTTGSVWDTSFAPVGVRPTVIPAGVSAELFVLNSDGVTWISVGSYTDYVPSLSFESVPGVAEPVRGVRTVFTPVSPSSELPVFGERYRLSIDFEAQDDSTLPGSYANCAESTPMGTSSLGPIFPGVVQAPADRCANLTVHGAPPGTDPGDPIPGVVVPPVVSTDKTWTTDGRDSNAVEQQIPLWITDSGARPEFGLTIGAENNSDFRSLSTLSILEPALPTADQPQTNPFEYIKVVSFEEITLPEYAEVSTLSVELFDNLNATAPVYSITGQASIADVLNGLNTYLASAAGDAVVQLRIGVSAGAPFVQPWDGIKARLLVQAREATVPGATPVTVENFPALDTGGVHIDNTISAFGLIDPSDDVVLVYADDSVLLRALARQEVTVRAFKSLTPASATLYSADPDRRFAVAMRVNRFSPSDTAPNDLSYSAPIRYVIEDVTPEFWNMFELAEPTRLIGKPSGWPIDVRALIEYRIGGTFIGTGSGAVFDPTGSQWVLPSGTDSNGWSVPAGNAPALPAAASAAPEGFSFADVTGVRVTFWSADPSVMLPDRSSSSSSFSGYGQQANFDFKLRTSYRSDGSEPLDGTAIINEVSAQAWNAQNNTAHDDTAVNFELTNRASQAVITKTPTGLVQAAGSEINYQLSFENTGSTVLRNLTVVDTIQCVDGKPNLVWDPAMSTNSLGVAVSPASVTGITLDPQLLGFVYDDDCSTGTNTITLTFPVGDRLFPGEKVTVSLPLLVRAGHAPTNSDPVNYPEGFFRNTYHLEYTDELGSHSVDPVTATVAVLTQQGYWFSKYVREVVSPGEDRTGRHGDCQGSEDDYLAGNGDGWERTPCLVVTEAGGQAEWRLWLSNVGNLPTERITVVDVLPAPGDVGITTALSTLSRGSMFSSILNNDFRIVWGTAAEGTYEILYQTEANNGCVLTGGVNAVDPFSAACDDWQTGFDALRSNPEQLAQVTALRLNFHWDEAVGLMMPGENVQVYYTTTTPTLLPDGVDPESYPESWNSIGAWAQTVSGAGYQYFRTAPLKAGISYTLAEEGELADAGLGDNPALLGMTSLGLIASGLLLTGFTLVGQEPQNQTRVRRKFRRSQR